jgi:hypothetical protein
VSTPSGTLSTTVVDVPASSAQLLGLRRSSGEGATKRGAARRKA